MFKYFKDIVGPIYLPFRHPFKTIQRALSIQEEWKQTKSILRPHKYKLLFLTGIVTFPLYRDFLTQIKLKALSSFQEELQPGQPIDAVMQSFLKFSSKQYKKSYATSKSNVNRCSLQTDSDAIVILLKDSLQHPLFHDESQIFIKQLGLELLKDKEIEKHLVELLIRMINDVEVKYELKELFKWAATQDDVKDAVILVLKNTGEDPRFRQSLSESLSYAVNDVLMRKETSERFKMFAYYLLESEAKSGQGIKGVIDLIVQKAIKKKTESSKNGEFDRIMKGLVGNEGLNDLNENRQQFSNKNDKNPQY